MPKILVTGRKKANVGRRKQSAIDGTGVPRETPP